MSTTTDFEEIRVTVPRGRRRGGDVSEPQDALHLVLRLEEQGPVLPRLRLQLLRKVHPILVSGSLSRRPKQTSCCRLVRFGLLKKTVCHGFALSTAGAAFFCLLQHQRNSLQQCNLVLDITLHATLYTAHYTIHCTLHFTLHATLYTAR